MRDFTGVESQKVSGDGVCRGRGRGKSNVNVAIVLRVQEEDIRGGNDPVGVGLGAAGAVPGDNRGIRDGLSIPPVIQSHKARVVIGGVSQQGAAHEIAPDAVGIAGEREVGNRVET